MATTYHTVLRKFTVIHVPLMMRLTVILKTCAKCELIMQVLCMSIQVYSFSGCEKHLSFRN